MKFRIGDKVRLKTGHPIGSDDATVSEIDTDGRYVTLLWRAADGTEWNSASPAHDLELALPLKSE
jgi:hypothetical protein